MKIEELIQLHNETLSRKAKKNAFLAQRIKAHLKDREPSGYPATWKPLKKYALLYSFLFIILTMINFFIINGVEKKSTPSIQPQPVVLTLNLETLQPDYPGSISQAYKEVMK
jgi:hypothetical protein